MAVTLYGSGQIPIQIVSFTLTTTFSSSSTTGADTGITASITPRNVNNKILVIVDAFGSTSNACQLSIYRNGTPINIATTGTNINGSFAWQLSNGSYGASVAHTFLDSPATTSAITYTIYGKTDTGTFCINKRQSDGYFGNTSTITLMEIAYA